VTLHKPKLVAILFSFSAGSQPSRLSELSVPFWWRWKPVKSQACGFLLLSRLEFSSGSLGYHGGVLVMYIKYSVECV
jgi:hypothetical protein